jgi:hypothetical protein
MRRFRTQWLALFGAMVVLSLSVSSAFAARPTVQDESSNFGLQVSSFVHALLSGTNDEDATGDENEDQDEDTDGSEDCQPAEETGDETTDETGDETTDETGDETTDETSGDESGDEIGDEDSTDDCDQSSDEDSGDEDSDSENADAPTAQNHGQCVAEVAHDRSAVGENGTHGWAVVLAAQVTCWLQENADDSADSGDEDSGSDENSGTGESAATKPHGKSDAAHQRKLERGHGRPTWAGAKAHGGHGQTHAHGQHH